MIFYFELLNTAYAYIHINSDINLYSLKKAQSYVVSAGEITMYTYHVYIHYTDCALDLLSLLWKCNTLQFYALYLKGTKVI